MLLNQNRKSPHDAPTDEDSFCPDCKSQLIGKRGNIIRWHWAHKSLANAEWGCHGGETDWHLMMKDFVKSWEGWSIEHPIWVANRKFRLDACHEKSNRVIEFVHSLNPHYATKHRLLVESGRDVMWIADGVTVMGAKPRFIRRTGDEMTDFLKRSAQEQFAGIPLIVCDGHVFWQEIDPGVWKPCSNDICDRLRIHHLNQ